MITYIAIAIIISITFYIVYTINNSFDIKLYEKSNKFTMNIDSDYYVILSLLKCPYCETLEEKIKDSKVKYTIITLQDDYSLKFDNTFLDIPLQERQSITQELKKLFINDSSEMLFPTIVFRNKIYNGLPDDETLKKLFKL